MNLDDEFAERLRAALEAKERDRHLKADFRRKHKPRRDRWKESYRMVKANYVRRGKR